MTGALPVYQSRWPTGYTEEDFRREPHVIWILGAWDDWFEQTKKSVVDLRPDAAWHGGAHNWGRSNKTIPDDSKPGGYRIEGVTP